MNSKNVFLHIQQLINSSRIGAFALSEGKFIYTNRALSLICGFGDNELLNFPFSKLLETDIQNPWEILEHGTHWPENAPLRSEGRIKTRSGDTKWVEVATTMQIIDQMPIILGTIYDLTERREAEEQMRVMSQRDPLTGLVNRNLFLEITEKLLALAKRKDEKLAILFLDLDQFKQVNDLHGHDVGDRILQETARRISACIRKSDTACRIGGDEFIVLLENISDQEKAFLVGEKIRKSLLEVFDIEEIKHSISSSIGIAIFPDHGSSEADLIRGADQAMYHAKRSGKNQISISQ